MNVTDLVRVISEVTNNLVTRIRALEARAVPAQSYSNILVNPGFELWQAGNGPFTTGFGPDLWELVVGAGSTLSVERSAVVVGPSSYSAKATYTHVLSSKIRQTLGANPNLVGTPHAISVKVHTNVPGAVRVFADTGVGIECIGNDTWETLVLVATPTVSPLVVGIEFLKSCVVYIDNVQLVQGVSPVSYIARPYKEDLEWANR